MLAVFVIFAPIDAAAESAADANRRGVKAYKIGEFAVAAEAFQVAWKLSENFAARKNEAIAWFKAERCPEAITAAASFVSYGTGPRADFVEVNSVIANCKAAFARAAIAAADLELADTLLDEVRYLEVDEYAREQVNLARVDLQQAWRHAPRPIAGEPAVAGSTATVTRKPRPWAYLLFGAGIGTLVGAVSYHLAVNATTMPRLRTAVADRNTDPQETLRLARRASTANVLIPVLYLVGAGATLAGGYFVFVAPQPGGATVSLAMRF